MQIESVWQRILDKTARSTPLAAAQGVLPYIGDERGWHEAKYDGAAWWTNGFWPGIQWQLYAATGEEAHLVEARRVQALIVPELLRYERLNHDMAFLYLLSCGADAKITGDETARRHTLHAAALLQSRFNPAGFIRAWNGAEQIGWAIVDCLMNLPILYRASKETGDPRFRKVAMLHADMSIRHFLRADGSCRHIVALDPETGEMLDEPQGQGFAPGSSWSRGQAWALYGFALSHHHTGEPRYLAAARCVAGYFIENIRQDGLTDCDFRQPKTPERLDNLAGAIAASGLLLLESQTGEAAYREQALRLLSALVAHCADWTENTPGILQKCTAAYHERDGIIHKNIIYGDYFFIEALARLRGTDPMLWA